MQAAAEKNASRLTEDGLSEDLRRRVEDFARMQQAHQEDLLAGRLKEVFAWGRERETVFRNLVRGLESMLADSSSEAGGLAWIGEAIKKLLAEDAALQLAIAKRQEMTQEQLLGMRRGKEALHGYGGNRAQAGPRYLSSRL